MVALAVIMVALLLLAMRRYKAHVETTRELTYDDKSEGLTDSEVRAPWLQVELSCPVQAVMHAQLQACMRSHQTALHRDSTLMR